MIKKKRNNSLPLSRLFIIVLEREKRVAGYNAFASRYTSLTAAEVMANAKALVATVKGEAALCIESGFVDGAAAFNVAEFNRQAAAEFGGKFVTNTRVKGTRQVLDSTPQNVKEAFLVSFTKKVAEFVASFLCDVTSKETKQRLFENGVTAEELMP